MTRPRSRRFTVRTSTATGSYMSWERAAGAARSLAAESGTGTFIEDDDSGSRWHVSTVGLVTPSTA
jgi:hypothetical protein